MFRRYYNVSRRCSACAFGTRSADEAVAHTRQPGHTIAIRDSITDAMWPILREREDKAIIYETDDDHFAIRSWNGYYPDVVAEHPLIRDMARRADLMTVSTPFIAAHYGPMNPNTRVIRNAVDPALYVADEPRPEGDRPRLLYYGSDARMRDYALDPISGKVGPAYRAVRDLGGFQRVFIGWNGHPDMKHFWDELVPYIKNIPAFSKAVANAHADIGLAPLVGDDFDQAKSELHWLEYTLGGAATIAQRFSGPGPYSVIRNGIDGLMARGHQEWHDGLKKLRDNPAFAADLAAAAKERVLADYTIEKRAVEWADAFKWAAENRGIGLSRYRRLVAA